MRYILIILFLFCSSCMLAEKPFEDVHKKTVDAVIRGYGKLHDEKDEEHFKDYLITNLLLYKDKWEGDIAGELPDITTPEYEAATQQKTKYTGGAEPEAAPPMPALQEIISTAIKSTIVDNI